MARATTSRSEEPTIEDLQAQIVALKDDISTLTETLKEYGKAQGQNMAAAARERAEKMAADGEATFHAAEAQARRAYQDAETSVREHPATAVGVAAGLGFLVGLVAGRR